MQRPQEQIEQMRQLREEGLTLQAIGEVCNPPISRQRVHQLIGNTGHAALLKKRHLKELARALREGKPV